MADSDDLEELLGEGEDEVERGGSDVEDRSDGDEEEDVSWEDAPQVSDGEDRSDGDEGIGEERDDEEEDESGAVEEVSGPGRPCLLCREPVLREPRLGPLLRLGRLTVHHFCLMLSSGLQQVGEDDQGVLGFLLPDIRREVRRGARLKCHLCGAGGASVGCAESCCPRSFHLPCLLRAGGLALFHGSFPSYCPDHRPRQKVPGADWKAGAAGSKGPGPQGRQGQCGACLERLVLRPGGGASLWTPCCRAWYHRACVERVAEAAGCHHTRCPLCNNKEVFQQEMLQCGVYIPDRDAAWELEAGAFQDLYRRHATCDHQPACLCPHGRGHTGPDTDWELVLCELCGAQGVHVACANLDGVNLRWRCGTCKVAIGPGELELPGGKEWVEDRDTDTEDEEEDDDDEDETEDEEEEKGVVEDERIIDAAVFEKCFASADERMWSAVTRCWRVGVGRLDLEDPRLRIGNRAAVLELVRAREREQEERERQGGEGELLLRCSLCSFQCQGAAGLARHGRLHDPGRPHACADCGLRFLKESHVQV
jgi:hypothetical protein